MICDLLKTIRRWTVFPVRSYRYAREANRPRCESILFAVEMSAKSQWKPGTEPWHWRPWQ